MCVGNDYNYNVINFLCCEGIILCFVQQSKHIWFIIIPITNDTVFPFHFLFVFFFFPCILYFISLSNDSLYLIAKRLGLETGKR